MNSYIVEILGESRRVASLEKPSLEKINSLPNDALIIYPHISADISVRENKQIGNDFYSPYQISLYAAAFLFENRGLPLAEINTDASGKRISVCRNKDNDIEINLPKCKELFTKININVLGADIEAFLAADRITVKISDITLFSRLAANEIMYQYPNLFLTAFGVTGDKVLIKTFGNNLKYKPSFLSVIMSVNSLSEAKFDRIIIFNENKLSLQNMRNEARLTFIKS